ncbi:hypothetical protein ACR79N_10180 [Sphingobacterium siyangense]|uniref:hypothetical protein n=1 Tax=Sphingobacterium siyangense TaxID=459529 RepID=UPI003DA48512
MLFESLLTSIDAELSPAFDQAFNLCLKNQTHKSDLLLLIESASLVKEPENGNISEINKIYYTLGEGWSGHCQSTLHQFIGDYVKGNLLNSHVEYGSYLSALKGNYPRLDELERQEASIIQVEMLIYLKIWEGELFLKQWYQLSLLLSSQDYDWDFDIGFDRRNEKDGVLTRSTVHKKVSKNLRLSNPVLHRYFNTTFVSQLRNAIAHSQYAMFGRKIHLTNFRKNGKGYDRSHIDFEEWNELFAKTVSLFTRLGIFVNKARDFYFQESRETRMKREIRVSRRFPSYSSLLTVAYTRPIFKDWSPYPNP